MQALKKVTGLIILPLKFVDRFILKYNTNIVFNFVWSIAITYFTISSAINNSWLTFGICLTSTILSSFFFGLSLDSWLAKRAQKKYNKKREEYEAEKYARHINEWLK